MAENEASSSLNEKSDTSDNTDETSDAGGSFHQDASALATYPLLSSLRLPESLRRISPSPSDDTSRGTSIASPAEGGRARVTSPLQNLESPEKERRSSARSVKRKKYDDEIVESSLRPAYYKKQDKNVEKFPSSHIAYSSNSAFSRPSQLASHGVQGEGDQLNRSSSLVKVEKIVKKRSSLHHTQGSSRSNSSSKRQKSDISLAGFFYGGDVEMRHHSELVKAQQNPFKQEYVPLLASSSGLKTKLKPVLPKKQHADGLPAQRTSWTAMDDLKFVTALQQLCDFTLVHKYVSFSTKVDIQALQHRWQLLLNDPETCRETVDGVDKIPLDTIQRIRRMKFFTEAEEEAIKSVASGYATLDEFARLLRDHWHLFFPGRTAEDLFTVWKYLSQRVKTELGKSPPQINPEMPLDLSAVHQRNRIGDIQTRNSCFGDALINLTRHLNFQSKHIGCEVAYLKALGERIGSDSLPDQQRPKFQREQKSALAVLSGICVDYAITTDEVSFGYSNEEITVDVDLSLEGNIVNLQPLQGTIFLDTRGIFHIENHGSSAIIVNGSKVFRSGHAELLDNFSVEIGTLSFQFYVNLSSVQKHVEKIVLQLANRSGMEHFNGNQSVGMEIGEESDEEGIKHEQENSISDDSEDESTRNYYIIDERNELEKDEPLH